MTLSILLIEDDVLIQETLADTLSVDGGFEVHAAGSIGQAQALMSQDSRSFDILLLDAWLPDGDGRTFCARLRQQGCQTPVLLLSGLGEENNIVSGFEAGADDYLVKPFGIRELLARIATQLRYPRPSLLWVRKRSTTWRERPCSPRVERPGVGGSLTLLSR